MPRYVIIISIIIINVDRVSEPSGSHSQSVTVRGGYDPMKEQINPKRCQKMCSKSGGKKH